MAESRYRTSWILLLGYFAFFPIAIRFQHEYDNLFSLVWLQKELRVYLLHNYVCLL